jgi:hypothetical protein
VQRDLAEGDASALLVEKEQKNANRQDYFREWRMRSSEARVE